MLISPERISEGKNSKKNKKYTPQTTAEDAETGNPRPGRGD